MSYFKSFLFFFILLISFNTSKEVLPTTNSGILSYEVNLNKQQLDFYWKDDQNKNYGSIQNLKTVVEKEGKELVFAMNGGMYLKDRSPQGLFIQKGVMKAPIDNLQGGKTNFYLHPNGIFYITDKHKASITTTANFTQTSDIKYATQSGPMLLINDKIHPKFTEGSSNLHIRNGVGVLPNGNLLFAMSKEKINFYDFACFFKDKGCKNALYLDGFVSRTYLPSRYWEQVDGNFGVIIAETRNKK